MEILKFGKLAALALAVSITAGCSSSDGDAAGEGAVDPNAGYNAGANGSGGLDSSYLSDEAALRAITVFYFEFDKYDLKPEAMRALDVHARDLKASGQRVVLAGHTDERGTREYNMALGERRANAAQRYLILQGVSPAQIEAVSYGEERPVALGSTEEAWAQNRRVEMTK
jgi:peptidoglycan-associated lipoprotein